MKSNNTTAAIKFDANTVTINGVQYTARYDVTDKHVNVIYSMDLGGGVKLPGLLQLKRDSELFSAAMSAAICKANDNMDEAERSTAAADVAKVEALDSKPDSAAKVAKAAARVAADVAKVAKAKAAKAPAAKSTAAADVAKVAKAAAKAPAAKSTAAADAAKVAKAKAAKAPAVKAEEMHDLTGSIYAIQLDRETDRIRVWIIDGKRNSAEARRVTEAEKWWKSGAGSYNRRLSAKNYTAALELAAKLDKLA